MRHLLDISYHLSLNYSRTFSLGKLVAYDEHKHVSPKDTFREKEISRFFQTRAKKRERERDEMTRKAVLDKELNVICFNFSRSFRHFNQNATILLNK
jgi:hypothetical protein